MTPLRLAMFLAITGALVGCKERATPKRLNANVESRSEVATPSARSQMVIGEMAIEVANPHPPMDAEQLAQALGRQLAGSGYFFALESETDPDKPRRVANFRVRIAHDVVDADAGVGVVAAIEVTATWVDGDADEALKDQVIGERPLDDIAPVERDSATIAHVATTLEEVGRGLIAMEKVRTGDDEHIGSALSDANPRVVLFALKEIGARKRPGSVDKVVPLLDSPSEEIRSAAITALVALGDPNAVRPLVKDASMDDPVEVHVIIEAVGALGGSDAEEYLDFVASGHPDPRVQEHAREALASARRRQN